MDAKWSGLLTLLLFFAITVLGFFLWVGVILTLWIFSKVIGVSTNPWVMLEALSTALAAAAVFSAGFIAYRELSEVSSSRHMEVADRLFNELNSLQNVEARRWIFTNLSPNPIEGLQTLTDEGRDAIKQVLNSLDHVAFLTQSGWIPEEIVMPWMHPMIAKSWEKLEPYVTYERQRRSEPYYYQKVSELANRCLIWRKRNLGITKSIWIKNAL